MARRFSTAPGLSAAAPPPSCFARLGLYCSSMCGNVAKRRRVAKSIQRVRKSCSELLKSPAQGDVPIEHLRAADQHLAAIETWLVSRRIHAFRDNIVPRFSVDLLKLDLGASDQVDKDELAVDFEDNFNPESPEVFVTAVLSSAISQKGFKWIGKLYVSSERLCFCSSVLGMNAKFSAPWPTVKSLRFAPKKKSATFHVFIAFKAPVDFDGEELHEIKVCVFDHTGLTTLHKVATYFLGTGLFDDALGDEELDRSASVVSIGASQTMGATSSLELAQTQGMLEMERRYIGFEWRTPFLPLDGVKKMRWCTLDHAGAYVRPPQLPENCDIGKFSECRTPPVDQVVFQGKTRQVSWSVQTDDKETDDQGWQYNTDFLVSMRWTPISSGLHGVRRRRWLPSFAAVDELGLRDRLPTTFIQERGCDSKIIHTEHLPSVSLEALGAALQVDDWQPNPQGGLMSLWFHEGKAKNIELGAWVDSGTVKGKARSVECLMPLPPNPMLSISESRMVGTFHVVATEKRVVLEYGLMTLDVPYGSSFYLWMCFTFTPIDGGGVKAVCTMSFDWVQRTMMKGIIETASFKEVPPKAVIMVDVVRRFSLRGK